jgi:hypothetical protein
MSDMIPDPEGKLSDDLFGLPEYEALPPAQRPFLPWHRPRKQYVRSEQWAVQIGKLFDDLGVDSRTLRYLGLPGIDLLDLRYFHSQLCVQRNLDLLFLGFNTEAQDGSSAQVELNISLDEVKKLPRVNPRSLIVNFDIATLANESSLGFKHAKTLGPFDVVNLDLCDGFGSASAGSPEDNQYNAMGQLLSLQFRNKNPWLLLLTTRVGSQHVHSSFLNKIFQKYLDNLVNCAEFQTISQSELKIGDAQTLGAAVQAEETLLPVVLTGLCKWLVGLAINNSPPSEVEVKSVIGYRVNQASRCEDLISMAIRFTPKMTTVADPMNVIRPSTDLPNECSLSARALRRVIKRKDADALLSADAELRKDMTNGMADLLTIARYDRASFIMWVQAIEGWEFS